MVVEIEEIIGLDAQEAIRVSAKTGQGVPDLLERWPGLPVFAPHDERIPPGYRRVRDGDIIRARPDSIE